MLPDIALVPDVLLYKILMKTQPALQHGTMRAACPIKSQPRRGWLFEQLP
jgi:hypothetical protein